jgi:uncharacterized protein YndB with AHSA1/START domain/predicted N-acetyltransferase YhbS
VRGLIPAALLF